MLSTDEILIGTFETYPGLAAQTYGGQLFIPIPDVNICLAHNGRQIFVIQISYITDHLIYYSLITGVNSSSSTTLSGSSGLTTRTSHSSSSTWCLKCAGSVNPSITNSLIAPNQPSFQPDRTKYSTRSLASATALVTPTRQLIDSTTEPARFSPAHLTSFGIFLITFGGVLVAFMMVSLIWICCGRERR